MSAKQAVALLRKHEVFIQRYAMTTVGVYVAHGPVRVSDLGNPDAIGYDLRDILSSPEVVVPHPSQKDWGEIKRPMLSAAGVKSWSALARGSKAVGVECLEDEVIFTPSANYGRQGGSSLDDKSVRTNLSSSDLGAKLLAVFAACE